MSTIMSDILDHVHRFKFQGIPGLLRTFPGHTTKSNNIKETLRLKLRME